MGYDGTNEEFRNFIIKDNTASNIYADTNKIIKEKSVNASSNSKKFSVFKMFITLIAYILRPIFNAFFNVYEKMAKPLLDKLKQVTSSGKGNKLKKFKQLIRFIIVLNMIPGICSLIIVIFLIVYLIWTFIQSLVRWLSFGKHNLPSMPIGYNKKITQIIYSLFYVLVSFSLLFFLFILNAINPVDNTFTKCDLDIIHIFKRLIESIPTLWVIAVVVIGSSIAKALYKISCGNAKTNINGFAKIVDSTVIALFIISIIMIILFKISYFVAILTKQSTDKTKFYKYSFDVLFNFNLIYIILRLLTLMFEEFASNKLVFLISSISNKVESPIEQNCYDENYSDTEKKNQNIFEQVFQTGIGIVLWLVLLVIVIIQMPFLPQLVSTKMRLDPKIYNAIKKATRIASALIPSKEKAPSSGEQPNELSTAITLPNEPSTAIAPPTGTKSMMGMLNKFTNVKQNDPSTAITVPNDPSTAIAPPTGNNSMMGMLNKFTNVKQNDPSTAITLPNEPSTAIAQPK